MHRIVKAGVALVAAPVAASLAACESATEPPFPVEARPTAFALNFGGYGFGSHDVTLVGDTLVVVRRHEGSQATPSRATVVPTPAQWGSFWRAVDAAGVRRWPRSCRNTNLVDGGGFTLEIAYDGGRITAQGVNAYPQRDGACTGNGDESPEYRAFTDAVSVLIGRPFP